MEIKPIKMAFLTYESDFFGGGGEIFIIKRDTVMRM